MKRAIYKNSFITPSEFEARAGRDWRTTGECATCRICNSRATPVGVHSTKVIEHFKHENDVTTCPYARNADPRFANLIPSDYDPEKSEAVRTEFLETTDQIARRFSQNLIGNTFNGKTYDAMLMAGNRLRIWEYRNIQQWVIPFILLTLIDFEAKPNLPKKPYSFQFRLIKKRTEKIDILWASKSTCKLEKVFVPSFKPMNRPDGNPWPVSKESFEELSQ